MQNIVLAEYFTMQDLTLLFIARSGMDKPQVFEIPLPLQTIKEFVTEHYSRQGDVQGAITVRGEGNIHRLDEQAFNRVLGKLVAPLGSLSAEGEPLLQSGDVIWFVPHDDLHYVPLHALKLHGTHLIEQNAVCYTPSASVMKYCLAKSKPSKERRALVLGDSRAEQPLPFGRLEATKIAALFGTTAALGPEANKKRVVDTLAGPMMRETISVFHFACHGYFHPQQPLLSGVVLSGSQGEDILTAEDFFGLQLQADLVSLSACESGVSERRSGDELIGLTRALIYAGTPSVLVSLWAVDDLSTALLMERFYGSWLDGKGKAEALQQAQRWLRELTRDEVLDRVAAERDAIKVMARKNDSNSADVRRFGHRLDLLREDLLEDYGPGEHPFGHLYHWAPFILVGDWR